MTELVSILNITPDSFSDGGKYNDLHSAVERIEDLEKQGARIIDIGAESTRPGAIPISAKEEWQRLEPALKELKRFPEITFSLDTRHAKNAEKALDYGVKWINDVSGSANHKIISALKKSGGKYILMHNLGLPADPKKTLPPDAAPVSEIIKWGEMKISQLVKLGLKKDQIIFDPGIGFGKTPEQSWNIISEAKEFKKLGVALMFGHSRKSFLKTIPPMSPRLYDGVPIPAFAGMTDKKGEITIQQLDVLTSLVSEQLVKAGIDYLRVHNLTVATGAVSIS